MAPGPTPTLTMSAPASTRSATPAAVTTLPATTGTAGEVSRTARSAWIILSWWPWAVSTTSRSAPASSSSLALPATSPLMPRAAPTRSRPRRSVAGWYRVARSAPVRVRIPTQRPAPSTTGASRCLPPCSSPNACSGSVPAGSVSSSVDMTWRSWVNRSTPWQSDSVTTPTGHPSSTTITAPCARLGSRLSACPVVASGPRVSGVSCTRSRLFTQDTTSATTSTGMSCGRTARPPRRATVSAIRRPATAVMLATVTGIVVPLPSPVARLTSSREATADRLGTRNTSL